MLTNDLLQATTVYGDVYLVSKKDFESHRILLPIYCKTGRKRSEHHAIMNWDMGETLLHRGNIKEIHGGELDITFSDG